MVLVSGVGEWGIWHGPCRHTLFVAVSHLHGELCSSHTEARLPTTYTHVHVPISRLMSTAAVPLSPCALGTYCPAGSTEETDCPPGFYCPTQDATPKICPAGTYVLDPGRAHFCNVCPGGSFCASTTSVELCAAGHYRCGGP